MADSQIKRAIREEFEQEKESLLNQARREAEIIISQSQREAESMRKRYLQELERKSEEDRIRLLSQLNLQVRKEILLKKEDLFKMVLERIRRGLEDLRQDKERYSAVIKLLILEAKENFSEEMRIKVKVDREDLEICKRVVSELNLNALVEEIPLSSGGVIVCDEEERFICNNVFKSRLEKLTPKIREKIFSLLD